MINKWIQGCFLKVLLLPGLMLLPGCASPELEPLHADIPAPVRKTTEPYSIAVLDSVVVKRRDGVMSDLQVSSTGELTLGTQSRVVRGMPVKRFRAWVQSYYPGAEIKVREFRPNRITVLGEVFHQLHTDLTDGPMRVLDAIAAANGFTPLANKRRVKLLRQNAGDITVYELDLREMLRGNDLNQNLLLEPGDVITIPRNFL